MSQIAVSSVSNHLVEKVKALNSLRRIRSIEFSETLGI